MKMRKIFCCILPMIILFALSGCGESSTAANETAVASAMGRYVETEDDSVPFSAGQTCSGVFSNPQGEIFYWGYDDYGMLIYDMNGKKLKNDWFMEKSMTSSVVWDIFFGSDGNMYTLLFNYGDSAKTTNSLYKISSDGSSAEDVTPATWSVLTNGLLPFVQTARVDTAGNTIYYAMGQGLMLDKNGVVTNISSIFNDTDSFTVFGDNVLYTSTSSAEVVCFNTTNEAVSAKYETDFNLQYARLCASADSIYLMSRDGLYLHTIDGTIWECVAEGTRYKFGLPSNSIYGLAQSADGELYSTLGKDNQSSKTVCKYYFDETIPASSEKKLTIYSMWYSPTIKEGAVKFNELHPETTIDYNVSYDGTGTSVTDRIRTLNTELMSGNGADIIVLNGLPVQSYIKSGVLEDLTDIFQPMLDNGEILPNVSGNYVDNGKIYCMPVRFAPQLLLCDKEVAALGDSTPQSIAAFAEDCISSGKFYLPYRSAENLMKLMLCKYYDALLTANGEIDEGKFADFITAIKKINDADKGGTGFVSTDTENTVQRQLLDAELGTIFNIIVNETHAAYICVRDADSIIGYENFKDKYELSCINENNTFIAGATLGLNSTSEEKELARDFIRYMFTAEAQKSKFSDGQPTNTEAFNAMWDAASDSLYSDGSSVIGVIGVSDNAGNYSEFTMSWPTSGQREDIKTILTQASTPSFDDIALIDMLTAAANDYFTDICTAEAAAENAAHSMNMYLSEQS